MRRWNREGQVQTAWHNRKKIAKNRERKKQVEKRDGNKLISKKCILKFII